MPKAPQRRHRQVRRRSTLSPRPRAAAAPVSTEPPSPPPSLAESLVWGELKKIGLISGGIFAFLLILFFLWR